MGPRSPVLLMVALAFSCAGKSTANGPADASETQGSTTTGSGGTSSATVGSGSGGSGSPTAGAASNGGATPWGVTGILVVPSSSGGSDAGAGGDANDVCDLDALWDAITRQTGGVTACSSASPQLDPDEQLGPLRGAVVIDDDGRLVDITGRTGERKQEFLDDVADQRWPCLAGQTIGYACAIPN